jgi:hypothetical protein
MDENEKTAILDLLKTVRIGLIILAIVGGYLQKDALWQVIS